MYKTMCKSIATTQSGKKVALWPVPRTSIRSLCATTLEAPCMTLYVFIHSLSNQPSVHPFIYLFACSFIYLQGLVFLSHLYFRYCM